MNRDLMLKTLVESEKNKWDVVIIGGGATGLGLALDASNRGFSTILVEQSDFAKGTSGSSTKLVHGGVRYLAKGDIFLVIEALKERGLILKNAPNITRNQEFFIPLYSWWDAIIYTVGLTFYDWLAGRKSIGRSHYISKNKTIHRLPTLISKGLKGSVVYHDGQFDDARMAIALAETATKYGAVILNYFKAISLQKNTEGKLIAITVRDEESGRPYVLNSNCIINATGVFADAILHLDNPVAALTIRPSQGIHLVLDKLFLSSDSAIMIPKTSDGRVLFCIPWHDRVIIGTTDTPINHISLEPRALEEEIKFILSTAALYLRKPPEKKDILSVFAGLRPLAANPHKPESTKEISRRHKIYVSDSGLISIIGGKWTTYRQMACETIDKAISLGKLNKKQCHTENLALFDNPHNSRSGRFSIYGRLSMEIEELIMNDPSLEIPLHQRLPYCKAEIISIIKNEMPRTVEDVLSRRTRSLILDADASVEIAPLVASLLALELGRDEIWEKKQIAHFTDLAQLYKPGSFSPT
jgi:glycerol-3-phosphate dehydrogenase